MGILQSGYELGPLGNPLNKIKEDTSGDQPCPETRTVAPRTAERGDSGTASSISVQRAFRLPLVFRAWELRTVHLLWFIYVTPQGLRTFGVPCVSKRLM